MCGIHHHHCCYEAGHQQWNRHRPWMPHLNKITVRELRLDHVQISKIMQQKFHGNMPLWSAMALGLPSW